jgi:spermidine synthase
VAAALCFIFWLSGASALIFEALWFRLASLAFGSSVWASSLVLSSFMAGLGLGNALAGSWGRRWRRPLRAYAVLEVVIGVTGFVLVLLLPLLGELLAPLFRPFLDRPTLLNPLRLAIAFLLMLLPATAMGATLPILVKALSARDPNFGRVLGRLYGWNTLGGVAGALAAETVLVGPLGLRGTGLAAGLLNVLAALCVLLLVRLSGEAPVRAPIEPPAAVPSDSSGGERSSGDGSERRLLAAAVLCGGTLLALEVVWFRFLLLFVHGTALNFSLMLAAVLLGIGAGGALAGVLLGRWPAAYRAIPILALASVFTSAFAYIAFDQAHAFYRAEDPPRTFLLACWMALPTSLLSGALFTFIGRALKEVRGEETRTAAALTLANTLGGMAGAFLGGFVLLPGLGMERSFFLLSVAYVAVAGLGLHRETLTRPVRLGLAAAAICAATVLALFPFGLMKNHYLKTVRQRLDPLAQVAAVREGRLETIQYLRRDFLGEPLLFRLITNGFSMSGTSDIGQRYMRFFVYWALAVQPKAERALLISYGVGNTAQALTQASGLRTIDVVDISEDVLNLAGVPYSPPPLQDPRVRVHLEDGRFFLQTTALEFDLITAEPPPLRVAGVVNLYTREYFELVRRRLAPGGVVTYWLPVYQVAPNEGRSLIRGFCAAFPDCTLWTAAGLEWMLAGTRDLSGPVDEESFTRQWRDPVVGPELRRVSFDAPELLGTTFLADAPQLAELVGNAPPLVDDFPQRMAQQRPSAAEYLQWMDPEAARERFAKSRFVAAMWPPALRDRTRQHFDWQALVNDYFVHSYGVGPRPGLPGLHHLLERSRLTTLSLWLMGSSPGELAVLERAIAKGLSDPPPGGLGLRALANHAYAAAERLLGEAAGLEPDKQRWLELQLLAALMAGDRVKARNVASELRKLPGARDDPALWEWFGRQLPDGHS